MVVVVEEEAIFIRGVNTHEDPPNAHQAWVCIRQILNSMQREACLSWSPWQV